MKSVGMDWLIDRQLEHVPQWEKYSLPTAHLRDRDGRLYCAPSAVNPRNPGPPSWPEWYMGNMYPKHQVMRCILCTVKYTREWGAQ